MVATFIAALAVERFGVGVVVVVSEDSTRVVARRDHPKMLRRPLGGGIVGDVSVSNPWRAASSTTNTQTARNVA